MNSAEQQLQQVLFDSYRYKLGGNKSNLLILNVLNDNGKYYIDYRNGLTYMIDILNDSWTESTHTVINFGSRNFKDLYRIDQPPNRLKMRKIWVAGQLIERINYVDSKEIHIKY
jgi:hypothetical protein